MLISVIFGFVTALLGSGALILLEGKYHSNWSTNIVIRFGDGIFLPVFNALTIQAVLAANITDWMIVVACVGTLTYLFIYQLLERHLRERDPSGAVFYHEFFTAFESFYVVIAVISLPLVSLANAFLVGYVLTLAYGIWIHADEFFQS